MHGALSAEGLGIRGITGQSIQATYYNICGGKALVFVFDRPTWTPEEVETTAVKYADLFVFFKSEMSAYANSTECYISLLLLSNASTLIG